MNGLNFKRVEFYLRRNFMMGMRDLFVVHKHVENGVVKTWLGEVKFTEVAAHEGFEPSFAPTLALDEDSVQQMMDELWAAGIRPKEGHGGAGQLGATQAHLADMKTIAFRYINSPPTITTSDTIESSVLSVIEKWERKKGKLSSDTETERDLKYVLDALGACSEEMSVANAGNPRTVAMGMNSAAQQAIRKLLAQQFDRD